MGHARVVRVLRELLLQDVCSLEIGHVALVRQQLRPCEIQGVEDLGFVIAGITGRQRLERLGARLLAGSLWAVRPVLVVGGDRLDVITLALGLRADPASLVDRALRSLGSLRG